MMTFKQLQYFIAVSEYGSISAAAHAVFISQSTLTLAIQQLEEELNTALFDRHAKGMTLTFKGHQFLRQAHTILAAINNAKMSLNRGADEISGQLTIGVSSLVAGYLLADLIRRFQHSYPNVVVKTIEDERPYIEHLLINGEVDVGVLILSNLENRQALQSEVLIHSPQRLWLPAQHPLLQNDAITLADVSQQPFIQLQADEMDQHSQRIWSAAMLVPNIALRTTTVSTVRSMVAAGLGVSIQPDLMYRQWTIEGDIVEARQIVDLHAALDFGIAWRRGSARPPLIDPFVAVARSLLNR